MTSARETAACYFIEASAGTGKTTQLIDHIVRCVASGTSLSRVVAVTFTHAAAGDMKLRLREGLDQAGISSAELELAFVGTIHSFCARLLRERPVEGRVDPQFLELAEEQANGLFARVFRRWAEQRLSEPNPTLRRALTRLTWRDDGDGRDPFNSLRKAALTLVEWRDHSCVWMRHPVDRQIGINSIVAQAQEIADIRERCNPVDFLIRDLAPVAEFATLANRLTESDARDDDLLESAAIDLLRATRYLKKGWGKLWNNISRDHLYDLWIRLKTSVENFRDVADAELVADLRDQLWQLTDLYQEAKTRLGQLDFNDLLFGAKELLQNNEARRYFQARFDRLFVDEFQDTDPVQAEIMLLLAAGDPSVTDWKRVIPAPGKLFVVGDPKQSIYRFRRADVTRYQHVKAILTGGGAREETLQVCRRSVEPILDFVNAAFQPVMRESYLPLKGGRPAIQGQPSVIALPMPEPYGKKNISLKEIDKCTPDAVAGFIKWLVAKSRWRVLDPETQQLVDVAPEHVCILFRNFTNFGRDVTREYLRALEGHELPHMLVGAKFLHGREEIAVLRAALRAVEWPEDSLSVYATLRGPLFAISDEILLLYKGSTGLLPNPLRANVEEHARFISIREALQHLAALHRARNSRPIAETLSLLLEHTRAFAGFGLHKGGERALANINRLIEIARRFEVNGATSFRSFIDSLEDESITGESSEAPLLDRKAGGVTIMTTHKSKGLEFPVVILADMTSRLVREDGPDRYVNSDCGLAAHRLLGWAPADLTENAAQQEQQEREEGWRLAYVAATRARDLLVVTAVGDQIREESWLSPLYPALYPRRGRWSIVNEAPGWPFKGHDTVLRRPANWEPEEILRPGQHYAGSGSHTVVWFDPSILPKRPETHAGVNDELLLKPTLQEPVEGLRIYEAWQNRRVEKQNDGISPSLRVQAISQVDLLPDGLSGMVETVTISADLKKVRPKSSRQYGDIVHAMLARAEWSLDSRQLAAWAAMYDKRRALSSAEREAAVQVVMRVFEHPLLREACAAERVHREYPLIADIQGERFEGIVDLLWFDGTRWTIVDFKTGTGDKPQYERQVILYGEAVRRSTAEQVRLVIFEIA